jgi:hypothetical protein
MNVGSSLAAGQVLLFLVSCPLGRLFDFFFALHLAAREFLV